MAAERNFFHRWRGMTTIGYELGGYLGNVGLTFFSLGLSPINVVNFIDGHCVKTVAVGGHQGFHAAKTAFELGITSAKGGFRVYIQFAGEIDAAKQKGRRFHPPRRLRSPDLISALTSSSSSRDLTDNRSDRIPIETNSGGAFSAIYRPVTGREGR